MRRKIGILLAIVIGISSILGSLTIARAEEGKTVIALDPGHDEKHAGATAGGLKEQNLTLKIAYYCKDELEKYDDIEVYMTRTSGECPYPYTASSAKCIEQRMLSAENAGAQFYVSLHLNAEARGTSANGVEVIYPNSSWKPEVGSWGKKLAQYIQTQLVGLGLYDRGIYYKNTTINERYPDCSTSDYYTVQIAGKESGIPSVIVENAFLTNAADRNRFLSTEDGLKKLGVANANAILKMLGKRVGWEFIDNQWYYYSAEVARTGWLNLDGIWYYLDSDGIMQTGWQLIDDTWYYLSASGAMVANQWIGKYYLQANGAMATNQWVGNYYTDETGAYISNAGWLQLDESRYYLASGGVRQKGWQLIEGVWYYFNERGVMLTDWQAIGGMWYYFNESGEMLTGWQLIDDTWYYLSGSGAMLTGWQAIGGTWYYLNGSGAMAANRWVGNYYVKANGAMATNEWIGNYWVGADGKWIPNK